MQCTVTDYPASVPKVNRTTQHTVGVDDELWGDCLAIAKVRRETMSGVIRSELVNYRLRHQALLDELKAERDGGPSPDARATGT